MCTSQTAINPINFMLFIYSNKIEYAVSFTHYLVIVNGFLLMNDCNFN